MTANCTNLMSTAIHLLESDAAFALRIQTSEPVLVGIARSSNDGVVSRASIALHRERERSDGLQTEACASVLGPYIFEQYTEPNPNQVQRSRRDGASSTESTVEFDPRERDHSDSGLSVPDTFAMVCAPYSLDEDPPEPPEPRRAAKVQRRDDGDPTSNSSTPEIAPDLAPDLAPELEITPELTSERDGEATASTASSRRGGEACSSRRTSRTQAARPTSTASTAPCAASTASTASCAEMRAASAATAAAAARAAESGGGEGGGGESGGGGAEYLPTTEEAAEYLDVVDHLLGAAPTSSTMSSTASSIDVMGVGGPTSSIDVDRPLLDRGGLSSIDLSTPMAGRLHHVLLLTLTLALTLTLTLSRPAPPRTATAEEGGPSDLCLRIASSATAGQAGGGGVRGRPARRAVCRLAVAPSLRAFSSCVQ